ncbi:AtuA-related protein [Achromobacter aegrifaciens]
MSILVYDLAHARAGDKGNTSSIAVIAYDDAGWRVLRRALTAERVEQAFAHLGAGQVRRYEVASLRALNFVIPNVLSGGVTRSLRLDPHGKSLSSLMLGIELPGSQPQS